MALRLNLYHEVHKAKALKRRDPLKISIYALSTIAALCACAYFIELVQMHSVNDTYTKAKAEFDKLEPQAKAARKKEEDLTNQAKNSELVGRRIEERFYWAPLLAEFMQVVPRNVQIARLGADITGETTALRRCSMTVDGIAAGADPRRVAEELRTSVVEHLTPHYKNVTSTFKTLEDGTETVMLDGRPAATASFAIIVQFYVGEEKKDTPQRKKK